MLSFERSQLSSKSYIFSHAGFFISILLSTGYLLYRVTPDSITIACPAKVLCGLPCLACGGSRALLALQNGHMLEAIQFNPLLIFSLFVAVSISFNWLFLLVFNWQLVVRIPQFAENAIRRFLLLSIPLQWFYLYWANI